MMTFLALTSTALAALPAKYDLTFTATAGRREINGAHLVVEQGRPAKLTQTDASGTVEVEVSAQPDTDPKRIFIAADIFEVARDGRRRHLGRPQIVALAGEPATLEVGEKDPRTGRDRVQYAVRVLAREKR